MNIAFPALVLFLAVLPGFVTVNQILSDANPREAEPSSPASFSTESVLSIIVAAALHACGILCIDNLLSPKGIVGFDAHALVSLLIGHFPDEADRESAVAAVSNYYGWIFLYFSALTISGFLVGTLIRYIIVRFELVTKSPWLGEILKLNDEWYHYFRGTYERKLDTEGTYVEPDGRLVVIRLVVDDVEYVHWGVWIDHGVRKDGSLRFIDIVLANHQVAYWDKDGERQTSEALNDSSDGPTRIHTPLDAVFVLDVSSVYLTSDSSTAGPSTAPPSDG